MVATVIVSASLAPTWNVIVVFLPFEQLDAR